MILFDCRDCLFPSRGSVSTPLGALRVGPKVRGLAQVVMFVTHSAGVTPLLTMDNGPWPSALLRALSSGQAAQTSSCHRPRIRRQNRLQLWTVEPMKDLAYGRTTAALAAFMLPSLPAPTITASATNNMPPTLMSFVISSKHPQKKLLRTRPQHCK